MKKNILVSVIVPVYGVEKYIERCARSLFEQTMTEGIEFIFVDDATPDKSIEILRQIIELYPDRKDQIKIISHNQNHGLAMARTTGVQHADGEYIFHCDSDDWVESDTLLNLFHFVTIDPEIDIVSGRTRSVYPNRQTILPWSQTEDPHLVAQKMLARSVPHNIWNRLIRKKLYEGLDIPKIDNGEDYVTTPRLYQRAKKIKNCAEVTYNYEHRIEGSFFSNASFNNNSKDLNAAVAYLLNYYVNNPNMMRAINVGHIRTIITMIITCKNKEQLKQIQIPDHLKSILNGSHFWKYRLIALLQDLKLYNLIFIISKIYNWRISK